MKTKTWTHLGFAEQHGKMELTDANVDPKAEGTIAEVQSYLQSLKKDIVRGEDVESFWWRVANGTSYCGEAAIAAINEEMKAVVDRAVVLEEIA